jgi:hypothetical protein
LRLIIDEDVEAIGDAFATKAIITDNTWGVTDSATRHNITTAEHKMYEFLAYTFYRQVTKHNVIMNKLSDMKTVRTVADRRNSSLTSEKAKWKIPSDEEIQVNIRTMHWTIDYWVNGTKILPFMTPTAIEKTTKRSKHGWELDENGVVRRAKKIHIYRETPYHRDRNSKKNQ